MTDIIQVLVTAFTQMATDAMTGIGQVLPVVLPILAAIIVIGVIIKIVRRIVGR